MSRQFYKIKAGKRYKKDIKRLVRSNVDLEPLEYVIDVLSSGNKLPAKFLDHKLKGELEGTRECHIKPDWILRYAKDDEYFLLLLLSTGDHRHVLGKK